METKDRIELLRWLVERSDSMRTTYSNRAALILSADAIILAAIAFLLEKYIADTSQPWKTPLKVLAFTSLALMTISFVLALTASIGLRSSRDTTNFKGLRRGFLNPRETFELYEDFDAFKEKFGQLTDEEVIESGCAELWVDLQLQQIRYARLKRSVRFILGAFLLLVAALMIALFR